MIEYLNIKYPINNDNPPYLPFNIKDTRELQEKYREDIERIKNRYPNINFLEYNAGV